MAKRSKTKTAGGPGCPICLGAMTLSTTIPQAHIFPELRTYRCDGCGYLKTVEDEGELSVRQAA